MMTRRITSAIAFLAFMAPTSWATGPLYTFGDTPASTLPIQVGPFDRVYSGTIGSNWSALPSRKHIYYTPSGRLNFSGPIYLTGYSEGGGPWVEFPTPHLMSSEPWFNQPTEFESYTLKQYTSVGSCFYHPCPENTTLYTRYPAPGCAGHACGGLSQEVHNFEAVPFSYDPPPFGTFDGNITIQDKHGGSTDDRVFYLQSNSVVYLGELRQFFIVFRWAPPGRWRNADTGVVEDKFPGAILDSQTDIDQPPFSIPARTKIVHHTSSDITGASPGTIDASDLAALANKMNDPCVGYGTITGCQHFNWYADINADGVDVDASDLSLWTSEADGYECDNSPAKVGTSEKDRILAWFGIAATGRTITFEGSTIPEYDVVNWVQCQQAIADPYGYKNVQLALIRQNSTPRDLVLRPVV